MTNFLIFFQKWHQNRVKLRKQWRNLLSMSPPSRPTWTSPITQRPSLQQSLLPIWRKKRLANKWFDFTNFSNCTFLLKWFCAILLVIFFVFFCNVKSVKKFAFLEFNFLQILPFWKSIFEIHFLTNFVFLKSKFERISSFCNSFFNKFRYFEIQFLTNFVCLNFNF